MSNLKNILLKKVSCKSIWFMRQAGRYLPEFQKIRSENPDFIKLCLNSELSSEITLQPIKRFNLDSAIIFSDILMVPYALGQNVFFNKNEGPELSDYQLNSFMNVREKEFSDKLSPVYKAIEITRKKLTKEKSLISFIGAPWTLLVYILKMKKNKNEINLKILEDNNLKLEEIFQKLISYLCLHIKNQINAGSDVIQIFDSWAGLIPNQRIKKLCYLPNLEIVDFCRENKIPTICFPKGIGKKYKEFNEIVKPNGINLDQYIDPLWAKNNLRDVVIQGGLSPDVFFKSDREMISEATKYIKTFEGIPYVFNLGHGLLPETDPDKVERLVNFYRSY